ncbi:uncharacterized protein LOC112559916 [Pomacea canaliculata]|uniref:uncharacterized protein LOC112559916 n=1 Tax=Pomacea canaliculata TaxID=400727 RepID=UPI000D73178B|nr:uncharacterized protein LOC112559916 [Pomacea canaliculata]
MPKSCLVLTGFLLFIVPTVSERTCRDILDACKKSLRSSPTVNVTNERLSYTDHCKTVEDHNNECNSYNSFFNCVTQTAPSCVGDNETASELQRVRGNYDLECSQERLCYLEVWNCNCLTNISIPRVNSSSYFANACKNRKLFQDCIDKIEGCNYFDIMKNAVGEIIFLKSICQTETDPGQNCSILLRVCNLSLKSYAHFGVRIHQSIQLVQCHVIESVETTCSSFENLKTCANNTLLTKSCEEDPVISSELSKLQQSSADICSQDTLCALELVKCACSSEMLNAGSMCQSMNSYKDCTGQIGGCNKDTTVWQSLSVTFKMMDGACKTECPGAFACWMDAQDQVDYLFARLYSSVHTLTSPTCGILRPRFQCLSRNTSSCSDSLSSKWQRVEKSFEAVCTVFEQNTTKTWSCPSVRTCVDEAQLVPGVSLGDLKTLVSVSLSAADIGAAILTPSTWCRILIHATECIEQEVDACSLTTAIIDNNFAAANATVRRLCKGFDFTTVETATISANP